MNKTAEELSELLQEYISKYNSNADNINKNERKIQYIDNAIGILKKDGSLDKQIARNKDELTKLGYNQQLRDENSINLMKLYEDRKKLEKENESLSDINRLLEKAKTTDDMEEILNEYKKEIGNMIKPKTEEQQANMLVIRNIEEICRIKKSELIQDKEKISSRKEDIEKIISDVRNCEDNIMEYDLVLKLGILTPEQENIINKNKNKIETMTQEFKKELYGEENNKNNSKTGQLSSKEMEQKLNEENLKDLKYKDNEIGKLDKIIALIDQFKKSKKIETSPFLLSKQNDMVQEKTHEEQNNEKPQETLKDTNNSNLKNNTDNIYDMLDTNKTENNNSNLENPHHEEQAAQNDFIVTRNIITNSTDLDENTNEIEEYLSSVPNINYDNVYDIPDTNKIENNNSNYDDDIFDDFDYHPNTHDSGTIENNNSNLENPHHEEQAEQKDIVITKNIITNPTDLEEISNPVPKTLEQIIEETTRNLSKYSTPIPFLEEQNILSNTDDISENELDILANKQLIQNLEQEKTTSFFSKIRGKFKRKKSPIDQFKELGESYNELLNEVNNKEHSDSKSRNR